MCALGFVKALVNALDRGEGVDEAAGISWVRFSDWALWGGKS